MSGSRLQQSRSWRRCRKRLLRNHGQWGEQHSGADSPHASLWTLMEIHRQQFGKVIIRGVSTAGDAAERQASEYLASICEGLDAPRPELARKAWLDFALNPFPDLFGMPPGGVRMKAKDALIKKRLTDDQIPSPTTTSPAPIKAQWDPLNVFRHDLSIRAGG